MALFLPEILTAVFDAVMKNSLQTDETCRQIGILRVELLLNARHTNPLRKVIILKLFEI